jgi:hypothetical protein
MTRAPEGDSSGPEGDTATGDRPTATTGTAKARSRYLAGRMVGAARLDGAVIRAVRDDRFATFQALQVVLLAVLSAAMSGILPARDSRIALVATIIAWLAWVFFAHLAATRALGLGEAKSDWNRLLRTVGMALAPAILLLFSRIPFAGLVFFAVATVWTAVAMTGAVRHTYDDATWSKAIQASLVGWLAAGIVYAAIVLIDGQVRGG